MPIQVLMPSLSPTMTKGKLIKWCVSVGDHVESGTVVAEVETDKATMEVEAFDEGTVGALLVEAGTMDVAVNSCIAVILLEGENESDIKECITVQNSNVIDTKPLIEEKNEEPENTAPQINTAENEIRLKASPLARKIAKDKNIDLQQIKIGSGPYGRIIKNDVLNFATTNKQAVASFSPSKSSFTDVSTMRGVIADRLVQSKRDIPHFYLTVDCKLDQLISIRKEINNSSDAKVTINDFIVKSVGVALKDFPQVNSSWKGDKIENYSGVDVAIAVSLDDGLITPIIRNAENKSLLELSQETKSLVKKAKEGSLSSDEYQGGGITISNLGMFKIREFVAIINPPQSSILAVGAAEERAIVCNHEVKVATMLTLTLSVDHRVVDGALGAQFLNKVKFYLENPLSMLVV